MGRVYWRSRGAILKMLKPAYITMPYGTRLISYWSDATFQSIAKVEHGFEFSDFLHNYSVPFIFLDIGAHQGLFSIIASKNKNCQRIFAFEPVKQTYSRLKQNIALNQCESILCIDKAVGGTEDVRKMEVSSENTGAASMRPIGSSGPGDDLINVECIGPIFLSSLIGEVDLPIVVKIDVEGLELTVLKTLMESSFAQNIHAVLVEIESDWCCPVEIHNVLRQMNLIRVLSTGFRESNAHGELWLS